MCVKGKVGNCDAERVLYDAGESAPSRRREQRAGGERRREALPHLALRVNGRPIEVSLTNVILQTASFFRLSLFVALSPPASRPFFTPGIPRPHARAGALSLSGAGMGTGGFAAGAESGECEESKKAAIGRQGERLRLFSRRLKKRASSRLFPLSPCAISQGVRTEGARAGSGGGLSFAYHFARREKKREKNVKAKKEEKKRTDEDEPRLCSTSTPPPLLSLSPLIFFFSAAEREGV